MARQHLSDDLKRFIREQIQSVIRLEVLLLLHRSQPRSLTATEVANELGFESDAAQEQLSALESLGLLADSGTQESSYHYRPVNEALSSLADKLASAYSKQRVPILSLILSERPDRIRQFAEAFRLIRGKE